MHLLTGKTLPTSSEPPELAALLRLAAEASSRPAEGAAQALGVWPEGGAGGDDLPLAFALAAAEAHDWRVLVVYPDDRRSEVAGLGARARELNARVEVRLQTAERRGLGCFSPERHTAPTGASVTLASEWGMWWSFLNSSVPANAFHLVVMAPGHHSPADARDYAAGHFHGARLIAVWTAAVPRALDLEAAKSDSALTTFDAGLFPSVSSVARYNAFLEGGAAAFLETFRVPERGLVYDMSMDA